MRIALCGATGRAGSRILEELLRRQHNVLAIVRKAGSLPPRERVAEIEDDLTDSSRTATSITGADALVSAYAPPPDNLEELGRVTQRLVEATVRSGINRLLMVGGAGGLEIAPGLTLSDSGQLPPEWLPIARAHAHALDILRESNVRWTSLSPAAYFDPGPRTGHFRLGTDTLLTDSKGDSRISMEDYAIALVDELEHPQHERQRFTAAY